MHWFRKTLTLALAVFLPLVSGHCLLEPLPGFSFLECAVESPGGSDCCADEICQTVESTGFKIETNQLEIPAQLASLDHRESIVMVKTTPSPPGILSADATAAPPELLPCRQFVFRTASPPRAPSLAS